jgi:preprotein translocase subunit SecG
MFIVLIVVHVLICVGLILSILLQAGRGADLGAAFGGSSQTIFGSSGAAPFLNRVTTGVAIAFMITSLTLAFIAARAPRSSIMEGKTKAQQETPLKAGDQEKPKPATSGIPSDTETGK